MISPTLFHGWAAGIIISALCLILQAVLPWVSRSALRHVDQKIITQLSAARLVLSFLQYALHTDSVIFHSEPYLLDVFCALCYYTDVVVVCWTCFYYKNLRDQELSMIPLQRWNFELLSLVIWMCSILAGVFYLAVFHSNMNLLIKYMLVFGTIKLIVMIIIVRLYFIRIVFGNTNRRSSSVFRKYLMSFLLVCLMTVEVIISTYFAEFETARLNFYVLNSFHVLALTAIFVIPADTTYENPPIL